MKYIELTQGKQAIVDDLNYEWLKQWKWCINSTGGAIRVDIRDGKKITIIMSRLILDCPKGLIVDHINGNRLDNRRENLRICTAQQNSFNKKLEMRNQTGFKGVCWHSPLNKWRARIKVNQKNIHIGLFESKIEAVKAYNEAAKQYFGEYARLNPI